MKKLDIKKLIKGGHLKATEIKPNAKYIFVISVESGLNGVDILHLEKSKMFEGSLCVVVHGKPDDAMAIYEVKS